MTFLAVCFVLAVAIATPAYPQASTGAITGRTADPSGATLPGVDVRIGSPAMIGGERAAVTDEQGVYRFTALVPGVYRVTFMLPGFRTLNIDGVLVGGGTTMTIDGMMEIATVTEAITVTSTATSLDREAATVSVNWDLKNLEDLPSGKSLPSLVSVVPGLYATQYDVGASSMGGTAAPPARAYGRSGGNLTSYDGIVWDQTFGDFGSYEEVQIISAAKSADALNPGATFNFVVKSGGNDFRGSFMASWQDDAFQSNNVNARLLERGLAPTSNKYTRYTDFKGDIGGPILRDRLWFYGAYTDSYSGQYISGFISEKTGQPAVFYTRLYGPTLKLTYQPTERMKFDLFEQGARKWQPYRSADQFKPLEATGSQDSWFSMGPSLKWTYFMSSSMVADLSISRAGTWRHDGVWSDDVRRVDLTTTRASGAENETYTKRVRWQWTGNWSWLTNIAGKSHQIQSGFMGWWDLQIDEGGGYRNQQVYRYRSAAGDPDYFMNPDSVQVFDYPNFSADGEHYNSWYINDKIILSRKLTVNAGLRFERYSSWLPEQGNPGTGPYATRLILPKRNDFPVYNSLRPRISLAYDVTGQGRLVLRASYGRYNTGGSGTVSSPAPYAGNVNPAATIVRTYNNWDGTIPYVPRPEDLASVSGGGGVQRLDSNLELPYMDEYTAGIELGLGRDYAIRLNLVRKMDYGGSKTLNVALPYDAFTEVRFAVDPGRDNIVGTADDGVMQAWSAPRSHPNFGQIDNLITSVEKDEGADMYTSHELVVSKRYSNGWSLLASFSADFSKVTGTEPQNPNAAIYNWQFPSWHYGLKINGTYDLPWGLAYSTIYRAQSGEYYGRSAQMRNALNSTVTLLVEGRVGRYDWVKIWDNRFSKTFVINDRHSIEAMFDLYNTLNSSVVLSQVNTNGPDYLKPSTGASGAATATAILPPRIFRVGTRWTF